MSTGIPWKTVAVSGGILAILGRVAVFALASRKPPPPPVQHVALIGDSYAVGLGPELQKLLPDFKFAGVVGTNTGQWAAHSPACGSCGDWLTAFKPNIALVSLGVNDGVTPNPANYQSIVRALHGIGARVVWIEPPADVQGVAGTRRIIASLGVSTVPAITTPLAADGLHPKSYGPWARAIAERVVHA